MEISVLKPLYKNIKMINNWQEYTLKSSALANRCTMDIITISFMYMLTSYTIMRSLEESIRERNQLLQCYIRHQNYTRCSELVPGFYDTCRVYDESDKKAIGNTCVHQPCTDTSFNKTCLPMPPSSGEVYSYTCLCQEQKKPQLTSAEYHWSQWQSIKDSHTGFYREMVDALATDQTVLAMELR